MAEDDKYTELDALVAEAKAAGVDPEVAAVWLDGLVNFNDVLPQPLGGMAEAVDGIAIRAAGQAGVKLGKKLVEALTHPDPEKQAARKAKRKAKKTQRKARKTKKAAEKRR